MSSMLEREGKFSPELKRFLPSTNPAEAIGATATLKIEKFIILIRIEKKK